MAVYKQLKSKDWWYKFNWSGVTSRESTKQTNKRVAEQIEAAHRTALAKGEVGIKERVNPPTLGEFAERDFLPFIEASSKAKKHTVAYYRNGVKNLVQFKALSTRPLDEITTE